LNTVYLLLTLAIIEIKYICPVILEIIINLEIRFDENIFGKS